jgi:hypothetical protein
VASVEKIKNQFMEAQHDVSCKKSIQQIVGQKHLGQKIVSQKLLLVLAGFCPSGEKSATFRHRHECQYAAKKSLSRVTPMLPFPS